MQSIGLIPAAGLGKRLNLNFPKELLKIDNKALIDYSVDNLSKVGIKKICVIIRKGKEIIKLYLEKMHPNIKFIFCYQKEPYGNLIDAIKSAIPIIQGYEVHFSLADTKVFPSPYRQLKNEKLILYCFKATNDEWHNFGCVVEKALIVIDKPKKHISNLCWGGLSWSPEFTNFLQGFNSLTEAINLFGFLISKKIKNYKDYGLSKTDDLEPIDYIYTLKHKI